MDYKLDIFSSPEGLQLRAHTDNNGVTWFCAKDIATALDYSETTANNTTALFGNVPEIWKGRKPISTLGGEQDMLCLTEQGVYFFLGRSDKKKALPYQMWIAGEVVPSIRKHGAYLSPKFQDELIDNPDLLIRLATELKNERLKSKALQEQAENNRPKVIFADALEASKESILIGNLAKILRQNGIYIGPNRLFAWLRENGFLIKAKGELWNMPTQDALERGLFEIKTRVINSPDGVSKVVRTTKVTPKGQIFFVNQFIEAHNKHNIIPLDVKAVEACV